MGGLDMRDSFDYTERMGRVFFDEALENIALSNITVTQCEESNYSEEEVEDLDNAYYVRNMWRS